jgi:hypothetical protein
MTKEERHFVKMCAYSGYVHGCKIVVDKRKNDLIKEKYRDPVYKIGMKQMIKERLWRD